VIAGAYFIGDKFAFVLNTGMKKSVVFFFMLSGLLLIPYLYKKMGIHILAQGLFFLFWLPVPIVLSRYAPFRYLYIYEFGVWALLGFIFINGYLYIYEFGVWALLGFIFINAAISNDPRLQKTIKRFPFPPFLLFIVGALTTNILADPPLYAFVFIRYACILPLLICFLACYMITTVEEAEKLLWIMLTSAGILGIMMLLGGKAFGFVQGTEYAMGMGRLSAYIAIPFFGALRINPEIGAELFSFVGVISFCFWLNRYSFYARAHALIILIVSVAVIVKCQGRGAMIGFTCSIGAMTILSLLVAKRRKMLLIILKMGTVVASTVSAYWLLAFHSSIGRFYKHGTILFTDPMNAPNLLGRIAIWQEAVEVIFQHPFGVGLYGFDLALDGTTWLAHNLYLWLILSFGFIGFIGFYGLHSGETNLKILCIGGIGGLIVVLLVGIISPLFDSPHLVAMIWSPIAVIMAAVMSKDVEDKRMNIDGKKE
jgi:O-antigen ligase